MAGIKTKLKKDDMVKILTGKDKGKTGKVLKIDHVKGRVLVQGCNMVKKAKKARSQNEKGGIIDIEAPIHISNVMLVAKNGQATKVGYKMDGDDKVRYAKKSGEVL